ncbi:MULTISPECIES: DUF4123 domain-containing protein [Aliivibrio]|uniref:DUF4123 domain-containing protein n=1 Tax=Aliivibrio logei TaxID=688 RepID=A0A1B9P043_ALILO|nr:MULTISPECIES: DUF4123 domain-containing protein [Aliivibrio]MBB1314828.1 DUF4123 domain-containing protein [Aliivibrio sp. SR45-2]OCH21665.1 hypothetical protein A6E04_07305 [Aliivibrio logei]
MHEHRYLIVNPLEDKSVIERFYHFGGSDAYSLYSNSDFSALKDVGPWLLPNPTTEFLAYFNENPSGFLIQYNDDIETQIEHWKSLTLAGLDGEITLFRYYDRVVLEPMLKTFSTEELSTFLGSAISLILISVGNNELIYKNEDTSVLVQAEPWWKIEDHHFSYCIKKHAWALERQAWQRLPELMKKIHYSYSDFQTSIIKYLELGRAYDLQNEELEAYAINQLAHDTDWKDTFVFDAWYLDDKQIDLIQQIENKIMKDEVRKGIRA